MLDKTPIEFSIDQFDWQCKLAFEEDKNKEGDGKYLFWINDSLVTSLPNEAPPIQKDNIPTVCQSDNLVIDGEVTKRTTFQIFI